MIELSRLALKAKNESARIAAIRELLDRAYGRPRQAMEVSVPAGDPIRCSLMKSMRFRGIPIATSKSQKGPLDLGIGEKAAAASCVPVVGRHGLLAPRNFSRSSIDIDCFRAGVRAGLVRHRHLADQSRPAAVVSELLEIAAPGRVTSQRRLGSDLVATVDLARAGNCRQTPEILWTDARLFGSSREARAVQSAPRSRRNRRDVRFRGSRGPHEAPNPWEGVSRPSSTPSSPSA